MRLKTPARIPSFAIILLALLAALPLSARPHAQQDENNGLAFDDSKVDKSPPQGVTVSEIIQRFAAKEKEFKLARDQYTFRQDVKINTLDGNTSTGEYREVFDVTFNNQNKLIENVVFAPQSSLTEIMLDPEDLEDIRHRYPFVLTSDDIDQYQILYVGKEKIDELETYVFDIAPKQVTKGQRFFQGRIWVDQLDLQIVKSYGRPAYLMTKELKDHRFPAFVTYREQIDSKYWFPTYTKADEVLHFPGGKHNPPQDVHIKIVVKYQDYKRFQAKTKVTFGEEAPEPKK